jgi:hypothetical protein
MRKLLTACFVILVAAAPALARTTSRSTQLGFGWTFPSRASRQLRNRLGTAPRAWTFNIYTASGLPGESQFSRIMNGPRKTFLVARTPEPGA